MRSASRRLLATASLMSLVAVTGACSSDSGPDASPSPTKPTGCDGKKAPTFKGTKQAFESVASVGEGKAVGIQAAAPQLTKASSGAEGWSVATISIHARVLTNGIFAVTPDSVMLIDEKGRQCTRPRTNAVKSPLPVGEIDEAESASGKVSFLVPDDAQLSKYTVMYADDPASPAADAEWSRQGVAPSANAATSCAPGRTSPMKLGEIEREDWGESEVVGSEGAQMRITVEKPTVKPLNPSSKHPNDVDGLAVKVKIEALGSAAFVDRNMFQMVDGEGSLCRYAPLGTEGETLTTDLIQSGQSQTYTLIFWAPKGAADQVKKLQVIHRADTSTTTGDAGWHDPKEKAPYPTGRPKPKPSPSSSASPSTSGSAAPSSSAPASTPTPLSTP